MLTPSTVLAQLFDIMHNRRLTMREVSTKAGISEGTLSTARRGITGIHLLSAEYVAEAIGYAPVLVPRDAVSDVMEFIAERGKNREQEKNR